VDILPIYGYITKIWLCPMYGNVKTIPNHQPESYHV
jgi:hypothetical protein